MLIILLFYQFLPDINHHFVCSHDFWNSKLTCYVFFDKINHTFLFDILQWDHIYPFWQIIKSQKIYLWPFKEARWIWLIKSKIYSWKENTFVIDSNMTHFVWSSSDFGHSIFIFFNVGLRTFGIDDKTSLIETDVVS